MATCTFESVTPEMAQSWLIANGRNRTLSASGVQRLVGVIQRGEWMPDSTDGVGLDTNGAVVNGQHRLHAVVEAGVPVTMLVVRDVDPSVIKVIDQGRGRTLTQWLQIDGRYPLPTQLASAVSWFFRITEGHVTRYTEADRASIPQLLDLLAANKNIEASLEPAHAIRLKLPLLDAGYLSAYHYVMASVDGDKADNFFAQILTGESMAQPVRTFRERVIKVASGPDSKRPSKSEQCAWLVRTWEAFAVGDDLSPQQLFFRPKGKYAESFPKITGISRLFDEDNNAQTDFN